MYVYVCVCVSKVIFSPPCNKTDGQKGITQSAVIKNLPPCVYGVCRDARNNPFSAVFNGSSINSITGPNSAGDETAAGVACMENIKFKNLFWPQIGAKHKQKAVQRGIYMRITWKTFCIFTSV